MTTRIPKRRVAHLTEPGYRAGNSYRGRKWAKNHGYKWIDNDMQITKDRVLINCHWAKPYRDKFLPYRDRRRVSDMNWSQLRGLRSPDGYFIWTMKDALEQAAELGLNVEVEVKAMGLTVTDYKTLARYAKEAYGEHWKKHVWIKTLTDLGGYHSASTRLHRAHAAGFTTIILLRGKDRFRRVNEPWIDYTRGALTPR